MTTHALRYLQLCETQKLMKSKLYKEVATQCKINHCKKKKVFYNSGSVIYRDADNLIILQT